MRDSQRPALERQTVLFAGQVQGVGFRYTARRLAASWPITGSVRNLPNGQVELVVEGSPESVAGYLAALEREMAGYIRERHASPGAATGEFETFGIRY